MTFAGLSSSVNEYLTSSATSSTWPYTFTFTRLFLPLNKFSSCTSNESLISTVGAAMSLAIGGKCLLQHWLHRSLHFESTRVNLALKPSCVAEVSGWFRGIEARTFERFSAFLWGFLWCWDWSSLIVSKESLAPSSSDESRFFRFKIAPLSLICRVNYCIRVSKRF